MSEQQPKQSIAERLNEMGVEYTNKARAEADRSFNQLLLCAFASTLFEIAKMAEAENWTRPQDGESRHEQRH